MFKYLLFIALGSAGIYLAVFGLGPKGIAPLLHPKVTNEDLKHHYQEMGLKQQVEHLASQLKTLEDRFEQQRNDRALEQLVRESSTVTSATNQTSLYPLAATQPQQQVAKGAAGFDAIEQQTKAAIRRPFDRALAKKPNVIDHVMQSIYHWNAEKLKSLSFREYQLGHYQAAAQFGMTLLNEYPHSQEVDEAFLLRLGIACAQSWIYLNESLFVFSLFLNKYPVSHLSVIVKMWRALAYYRMGEDQVYQALVLELREKYQNTKEWKSVEGLLMDRVPAASSAPQLEVRPKKGTHEDHDRGTDHH